VVDEDGIVHEYEDELSGEAMENGPLMLAWSDVQDGTELLDGVFNVVIHEFVHVIDACTGAIDGVPPLPDRAARDRWIEVIDAAYEQFCHDVDDGYETVVDPYGAEASRSTSPSPWRPSSSSPLPFKARIARDVRAAGRLFPAGSGRRLTAACGFPRLTGMAGDAESAHRAVRSSPQEQPRHEDSLLQDPVRPGPVRDRGGRAARPVRPRTGPEDEAAGRRLHRADPDGHRAHHLLHGRHRHRRHARHEEGGPRRRQGAALLRGDVDDRAGRRPAGGPRRASGSGFNVDPKTLDGHAVETYATQAKGQSTVDFLLHIIPNTVVDAFAKGEILQVLLVALLFGSALSFLGERGEPLHGLIEAVRRGVLPHGDADHAARADRRVRRDGLHDRQVRPGSLLPLLKLIGTFYLTSLLFVLVVLGIVARVVGFSSCASSPTSRRNC
jgi:hypothetical protein